MGHLHLVVFIVCLPIVSLCLCVLRADVCCLWLLACFCWCCLGVQNKQYLRQVTYEFLCDHSVVGSAQPVSAAAQPSNDCNYTLTWKTAFACGEDCASDQVASKCDAAGTTCSVGPYTAPYVPVETSGRVCAVSV